jgi:hypothetical protein
LAQIDQASAAKVVIVHAAIGLQTVIAYARTLGLEDEVKEIEAKLGTKILN